MKQKDPPNHLEFYDYGQEPPTHVALQQMHFQMAEDIEFDEILKLTDKLDAQ